jgi:hypothetical protein
LDLNPVIDLTRFVHRVANKEFDDHILNQIGRMADFAKDSGRPVAKSNTARDFANIKPFRNRVILDSLIKQFGKNDTEHRKID